jgi:hypothetical protein
MIGAHGEGAGRRRFAFLFLVAGAALLVATVGKDYPREQPIVFRLADQRAATLTASFTKVGDAEALTGFTMSLPDRALRDVNHTIRVPNGDYLVTVELRRPHRGSAAGTGGPEASASSVETSVSRRVSLSGSEVVVPVPARASE